MSTYINPSTGKTFRVDQIDAPDFLREFLNHELVVRNLTARTVCTYFLHTQSFLRWLKCREQPDITPEDFSAVQIGDVPFSAVSSVEKTDVFTYFSFTSAVLGNGNKTRSAKLTALKAMYGYFCETDRISTNPVSSIKSPKKEKLMPKYLSLDESLTLLGSVGGKTGARDYCLITFFINCGMRLSELVGIDINHIRDDSLKLYGKGRKERIVYLNAACIDALTEYLAVRSNYSSIKDKQALWVSERTGKRLSARRVQQIVTACLAKAGLSGMGYSTHKLRHTAASLMYQNGSASVLELKDILGHESTSTTEIYTHLHQQQLKDALLNAPLAHVKRGTIANN